MPARAVEAPTGALEDTVHGISERRGTTHVRFEQTRQPGRMRNRRAGAPPREHRLRTRRRGCRGIETPASADLGTSGTNADRLPGVTAIRTVPTRAVEAPAGALEDTVRGISERRRATHVRFEQTRQPGRMRNRGKQSPRTRWTTSLSRDDTPPANPATERPKAQPVAHLAATRSKTSRKHPRTPPKNPATRRPNAQPAAHPGSTPTAVRHDRATPTSATTEPPAQQEKPR